jgi:uncharacterized protein YbcI
MSVAFGRGELSSTPENRREMLMPVDESDASEREPVGSGGAAGDRHSGDLARLTHALVAIYKEQFGRGPTSAYSHYAGPNAIVSVLEGTLTPVEHTLNRIADQRLRDIRMLFQHTTEPQFRTAAEKITGRQIAAFTSGFDTDADVASELFLFEPTT